MRYLFALLGVFLVLGGGALLDFAGWLGADEQWSRAAMGLGLFGGPILGFAVHIAKIPPRIRDAGLLLLMILSFAAAGIVGLMNADSFAESQELSNLAFLLWIATSCMMGALLFTVLSDIQIVQTAATSLTTRPSEDASRKK